MNTSLDQFCVNVSGLERSVRFYEQAIAAGADAGSPPKRLEQWPATVAFMRDPDGYHIELVETHAD